jgi:DHA2 family multidrug resistance protein
MKPDAPQTRVSPWFIATAVIVPTFLEVLDSTVVSVSLNHIAGNLSATTTEATWVQTSYLISNAVVLPASAWFASFFGRKRFLLACIALFTLASCVCGAAPSLAVLIVARVVQGAGGGALQPLSQAILLESFPPEKHGVAMAAYGLGILIAPVLGPVLGGWVTDDYSWRWLFYLNLPIGLLAIWMCNRFVFDPPYFRAARPGPIDGIGFGLMAVWLGTLQIVLDKGQDADWFQAAWVRGFSVISVAASIGFVFRQLRGSHPIADLRVFKDRNFTIGTVLISVAAVVIYGPLTLLPLFLQGLMGYGALDSGLAQLWRGIGSFITVPVVGMLINHVDNRKLIAGGFLLLGLSSWEYGQFNLEFARQDLIWPTLVQGVGLGMCMIPLMTVALGRLAKEQMGSAAGVFALARNLAGGIGIALLVAFETRAAQQHQAALVTHLTPYNTALQHAQQALHSILTVQNGPMQAGGLADGMVYREASRQAHMLSYIDDFRWLAVLCFIASPLAVFLKPVCANGPPAAR